MAAEHAIEREPRMPEAVLDAAMIESMRAKVGAELRIGHSRNNREVTRPEAPVVSDSWRAADASSSATLSIETGELRG